MSVETTGRGATQNELPDGIPGRVEDLVRKLVDGVPALVGSARRDLEVHFKTVLQEQLARLDLCSRSEFDAQGRVLARTQERLAQLEAQLVALEQRLRT